MKKIILIISLIVISVALLYGSFKVFIGLIAWKLAFTIGANITRMALETIFYQKKNNRMTAKSTSKTLKKKLFILVYLIT